MRIPSINEFHIHAVRKWIIKMELAGLAYHWDDDPYEVLGGELLPCELRKLDDIMKLMFERGSERGSIWDAYDPDNPKSYYDFSVHPSDRHPYYKDLANKIRSKG